MTIYNTSIVLEGGTFRTIYQSGILDVLIEENIEFPYIVGISAGAINACAFAAKQRERTFRVIAYYRNDKRYMGIRNFIKERSYFGLDFAYNILPNKIDPFDWASFANYSGDIEVGVTNAHTGNIEFMDAKALDRECTMLRATCALPILFPEIRINDIPYFDGGLADPIPVKRAEEKGFNKHVFILTRPKGYRKTIDRQSKWTTKLYKRKYPALASRIIDRFDFYNATMDYIEELERKGQAFVFRPDYALNSFEKDPFELKKSYDMGASMAKSRLSELKDFISES